MTLNDLAGYAIVEREPVSIDFDGYKLYATSAPSSGAVVLSALETLNQYKDRDTAGYDLITHRLIEATKFGGSCLAKEWIAFHLTLTMLPPPILLTIFCSAPQATGSVPIMLTLLSFTMSLAFRPSIWRFPTQRKSEVRSRTTTCAT